MSNANEIIQVLLDQVASGQLSRRRFMTVAGAAGLTAGLPAAMVDQAFAAGDNQAANQAKLEGAYDYIVVGAGASGAIVAGELSKTGAKVLVVESGGADTAPTISNPSIWFYNVGGPLDWKLPIAPVPQLNNRKFNMALGHVLGGGSSINAMVWSRGLERDYDTWERREGMGLQRRLADVQGPGGLGRRREPMARCGRTGPHSQTGRSPSDCPSLHRGCASDGLSHH
jgi:choline dehydrogenase